MGSSPWQKEMEEMTGNTCSEIRELMLAEEARDLLLEAARRGWVELLIGRQGATLVTSFPIRR